MDDIINLAGQVKKQLPVELVDFMQTAGEVAARQGKPLYLVGGVVRDLLLERSNLDLDLVVEGDAVALAQELAEIVNGKITVHTRFNTAKLRWSKWSVDLATSRSETYTKPGALPTVRPGPLASDLFRRDFTINAMAIELTSSRYGQLIDPYGARDDLEHKLVRVLHDKSFIDDATRIWRALRYEQRLDFQLEPNTFRLLKQNVSMLDTISGDRIRHELELVLKEELPEKVLCRAGELKVLSKLLPALKGDIWLAEKFVVARKLHSPDLPSVGLYLALLCYRLTARETEKLTSNLNLPKLWAETLLDANELKTGLAVLDNPQLALSQTYYLIFGYSVAAIQANLIAAESKIARQHIRMFLDKLRYVKPALTGNDLKKMGVLPGPRMKEILQRLLEARLDGKVTDKKGEEDLVRGWVR